MWGNHGGLVRACATAEVNMSRLKNNGQIGWNQRWICPMGAPMITHENTANERQGLHHFFVHSPWTRLEFNVYNLCNGHGFWSHHHHYRFALMGISRIITPAWPSPGNCILYMWSNKLVSRPWQVRHMSHAVGAFNWLLNSWHPSEMPKLSQILMPWIPRIVGYLLVGGFQLSKNIV